MHVCCEELGYQDKDAVAQVRGVSEQPSPSALNPKPRTRKEATQRCVQLSHEPNPSIPPTKTQNDTDAQESDAAMQAIMAALRDKYPTQTRVQRQSVAGVITFQVCHNTHP